MSHTYLNTATPHRFLSIGEAEAILFELAEIDTMNVCHLLKTRPVQYSRLLCANQP